MGLFDLYKKLTYFENYYYSDCIYPSEYYWYDINKKDIFNLWEKSINYNKYQDYMLHICIPFCLGKCFFCTHDVNIINNINNIDEYLDLIEKEAEIFSSLFKNKKFKYLYIGGGTPTILSSQQLERLYSILYKYYDLSKLENNMIESSPSMISEEKIEILSKFGVNKITFGIQDINSSVLQKNNRFNNLKNFENNINVLKEKGINFINVDLMAGIYTQTVDDFKRTLDYLNSLDVSNICLNIFKPTNKTPYTKSGKIFSNKEIGDIKKMVIYWKSFNNGQLKEENDEDLYDFDKPKMSILGLGYGVNSHIYLELDYKKNSYNDYKNWLLGNNLSFKGFFINEEYEMVRYILLNLKENGVSMRKFKTIFNKDLEKTIIYNKLKILINKGLLYYFEKEGDIIIRFKKNSWVTYSVFNKILYNNYLIKEFLKYQKNNKELFENIDLKLREYYVN